MDYIALLRQYRIGPFTIFDTVLAYVGVLILAPLLTKLFLKVHVKIPLISWLWFTMPISVIFHIMFRQDTPLMRILFNSDKFYIAAGVLLFMIYMGLRRVRRVQRVMTNQE